VYKRQMKLPSALSIPTAKRAKPPEGIIG